MTTVSEITIRRVYYALVDLLMTAVGWCIFNIIRYYTLDQSRTYLSLGDFLTFRQIAIGQVIVPVCMIALYALSGSYNKVNTLYKSRLDEVLNAAGVSVAGMLGIYFTALINDGINERITSYELMLLLWLCLFVPVAVARLFEITSALKKARSGRLAMRTIVVGLTPATLSKFRRLQKSAADIGLDFIGYVTADSRELPVDGVRHFVTDDVAQLCRRTMAQAVVVLPSKQDFASTLATINTLYPLDIPIFVTPDMYSLIALRPRVSSVIGEPLVDITTAGLSPLSVNFKRVGDIVLSAVAMVLLLPVYAILALAVKLDSRGPVIYRQERVGYHKKKFKILKFRTMRVDAEASGPELASEDDPRVTRTGRFMRKYRLDELPQFWNVFKGEMSLVGPRPEREYYLEQLVSQFPAATLLHQVRPGITSWGMVKYGYASSIEQMLERLPYDMLYIENMSLGVDLKIIFHTVDTVIRGRGQ